MSVTLLEVVQAARARAVPLAAESAGYLALSLSERALHVQRRVELGAVELEDDGSLQLIAGEALEGAALEQTLRGVLSQLLAVASSPGPSLLRAAGRPRPATCPPSSPSSSARSCRSTARPPSARWCGCAAKRRRARREGRLVVEPSVHEAEPPPAPLSPEPAPVMRSPEPPPAVFSPEPPVLSPEPVTTALRVPPPVHAVSPEPPTIFRRALDAPGRRSWRCRNPGGHLRASGSRIARRSSARSASTCTHTRRSLVPTRRARIRRRQRHPPIRASPGAARRGRADGRLRDRAAARREVAARRAQAPGRRRGHARPRTRELRSAARLHLAARSPSTGRSR